MGMLKEKVGMRSQERLVTLSETRMKDFATCVKATVGNTSHSPMTSNSVPTIFTIFREGEFEIIDRLGVQLSQILHAEQEYSTFHSLLPEEEIRYTTTLLSVVEKRGSSSSLAFLVFETDFLRTRDSVCVANAKSTMVYRKVDAK